jgi:hypothetical protein
MFVETLWRDVHSRSQHAGTIRRVARGIKQAEAEVMAPTVFAGAANTRRRR